MEQQREEAEAGLCEGSRWGAEAPKRGRCLGLNLRSPPCCLQERLGAKSPGPAQALAAALSQALGPPQPLPLQAVARQGHGAVPHPPRDEAVGTEPRAPC